MGALKYLSLILRFRNVAEVYKEETGNNKPWYYSRRFVGLVLTMIGSVVAVRFGIVVDDSIIAMIADNIVTIITAGVSLFGAVLGIVGHFKKTK